MARSDGTPAVDMVNHPPHYTAHPSGVECVEVIESCGLLVGNAIKYLWRYDLKHGLEDLQKARWYAERELDRRRNDSRAIGIFTEAGTRAMERWMAAEDDGPVRNAIFSLLISETYHGPSASEAIRMSLKEINDLIIEEVQKRAQE